MIEISQIRKSYKNTKALDGFNLQVAEGELIGLVGPNGAGKTTLIKILATLIRSDEGVARIAGIDVSRAKDSTKRIVGYMPDQPGLYQDMRVREFLEFFADAFQLRGSARLAAVDLALERSGLSSRSRAFVEELSFGMRQRLLMAKTLLHQPKVLLLDEPATGLDPLARIDLRHQLQQLSAQGMTILVSSHILSDLEDICSRVALISSGRNATDEQGRSVLDLRAKTRDSGPRSRMYELEILGNAEAASRAAAELSGVRVLHIASPRVVVEISGDDVAVANLLHHLITFGVQVVKFSPSEASLEDRYRRIFGKGVESNPS
ncbi:MAG: ABC transporter ATP-binding protein [Candidatus Acidiferrales bacterium]